MCVYEHFQAYERLHNLEFRDQEWAQTIDYEHILFRCQKCHEHCHMFRHCPHDAPQKDSVNAPEKSKDGFTQVPGKKRPT
jgi:hypothetical protein